MKKRTRVLCAVFTLLLLLSCVLLPAGIRADAAVKKAQQRGRSGSYIKVSTVDELVENIADDVTLVLEPGTYDLTTYLEENGRDIKNYNYQGTNAPGIYKDDAFDGYQLMLVGINNLRIMSADAKAPASIVCEPRYANVLYMEECSGIRFDHLIMGHTIEPGYCSGAVLYMDSCTDMDINDCDLYGCGTYGLEMFNDENVRIADTVIHDCTYGGISCINGRKILFLNTDFSDLKECFEAIGAHNTDIDFIGCSFRRLCENILSSDEESRINFVGCTYDSRAHQSLISYPLYGAQVKEE